MDRRLGLKAALLGLLAIWAAPAAAQAAADTPRRGGTLTYAVGAEPPSYDCHAVSTFAVLHRVSPHYSTLLRFRPGGYPELEGDAAESWTVSPDSLTYTFRLRPDIVFHDGTPFTSEDVRATYERLRNPPQGITSVRKPSFGKIAAIETPDPRTVVFRMREVDASVVTGVFASPWNCLYSAARLAQDPNFPARNVMGTGLCFLTSPLIARLTTIRFGLIAPFMVMVVCFGAFNTNRDLADLLLLLGIGALGLLMRRFGWSRPPFVVGFVLAQPMETYLYQAVQFYGWDFVYRPGVLIIALLIVVFVGIGIRQRRLADTDDEAPEAGGHGTRAAQALFAVVPMALFAAVLADALRQSFLGGIFPALVAGTMLLLGLPVVLGLAFGRNPNLLHDAEAKPDPGQGGFWTYLGWFAALVALSGLIGFFLANVVFFLAFLRRAARCGWGTTLGLTAIACVILLVAADMLVLDFPRGLLQSVVDLPWPLR